MKRLFLIYFSLAVGTANATDRWWEIRLSGQPAGYRHTIVENLDGGMIRTTEEQVIVINRLGSRVEVKEKLKSVESAAGDLISVREETSSSAQTIVTEAELHQTEVQIRSTAGTNSYTR